MQLLAKKTLCLILGYVLEGTAIEKATAMANETAEKRESTRLFIDPPTFTPPPEMRAGYLDRRRDELEQLLDHAGVGEWKPVMVVMNHVRGTGAMYGFASIGMAAENVVKAVQNGDSGSLDLLRAYADAVHSSQV